MTDAEILQMLKEAFAYADPAKAASASVTLDSTLADIGIDSVGTLEMVAFVEDRTGKTFPDDELTGINSVSDFVSLIRRHVTAAPQGGRA